jgi:Bacterial regulatory proteins, luxR family
MSKARIAESVVVSEATVKTHLSHVLRKLDLADRLQAVVLAYESGWSSRGRRSETPRRCEVMHPRVRTLVTVCR